MKTNNIFAAIVNTNIWAMEKTALESLINSLPQLAELKGNPNIEIQTAKPNYVNKNGEAVIKISGVLLKSVPSYFKWFGIDATSYDDVIEQVSTAVADPKIKTITLNISSPGGTVAGVDEAAMAIRNAREQKPVNAIIEDLGASAAYYLAAQANKIGANKNAEIGSIGVYCALADYSKMYETAGVKTIVISSGEFKGTGVPGTEITDIQLEPIQENINAMAGNFISAVSIGRGMEISKVSELATGRMWIAESAKANGLIDDILELNTNNNKNKSKGSIMNEDEVKAAIETAKTEAAASTAKAETERLSALQTEFPDNLNFALDQFKAGASVEQAKAAYCDVLKDKLKNKQADGAEALENAGDTTQVNSDDFMTAAKQYKEEKNCSLTAAMSAVAKQNPELHKKLTGKK